MQRAPEPRRPIRGATTSAKHNANCNGCGSKWDKQTAPVGSSPRTGSVSTTWSATSGSGPRIASTPITMERRRMARRGSKWGLVATVSSAAVLGTAIPRPSDQQPRQFHLRRPRRRHWLPCREDAYPLNPYLLGPGRETQRTVREYQFVTVAGGGSLAVTSSQGGTVRWAQVCKVSPCQAHSNPG